MCTSVEGGRLGKRASAAAALALLLLGFALYARSLGSGFVDFDDRTVLLAHPQLYDQRSWLAAARAICLDYFPREEPLLLRDFSWALDARLFGFANPLGYHLGNVLWNAVNGALLFLFLRRATRRFWLPFGVSAVFATLPVHVEAVSWVMGRKDVLSTALVLAALLAQSYELDEARRGRRWLLWLAGLLCTALALLAKIAAMSCVALLALHRAFQPYLDGRRAPGERLDWPRVLRAAPWLVPHAALTFVVVRWYQGVLTQFGVIGLRNPGTLSAEHLGNLGRFEPLVIAAYLRSLVWPFDLSAFYRWPHVEIPLGPLELLGSAASALALGAGLLWCCLRRRDLAFYALAFFALVLPYLGFVFVDIWRADRYVYLASFAVLMLAALVLEPLAASGTLARALLAVFALSFASGSALQTLRQQGVWRDNESLWRYEAYRPEPSLLGIRALASEYADQAEHATDAARRRELVAAARHEVRRGLERDRALGRKPGSYATSEQLQLGRLYGVLGKVDRLEGAPLETQIAHYETSFRLAPHVLSAFTLASLYLERASKAPEDERERYVRASFDRFTQYLAMSSNDPARRQRNEALLANVYERQFPYLGDSIAAARRSYLQ